MRAAQHHRRGLWIAAACALAMIAGGCQGSATDSAGELSVPPGQTVPADGNGLSMRTRIGPSEHRLDLIAWKGLAPAGVTAPFAAATGCDVHVTVASSSDDMEAAVRSGTYDGVSAAGQISTRLIADRLVAPIDTSLVPDFGDLPGKLQSPQSTTVNGVHYGLPAVWGGNPLMYNTTVVTPAPTSWQAVFRSTAYPGAVTAPDTPMYIADAALYLKSAQGSLDISDPYELTPRQFAAAVALLERQRSQVGAYWSSRAAEVRAFRTGSAVIGAGGTAQAVALRTADVPVVNVVPDEGMTGWADSWMLAAHASHPNCMLRWIAYTATPLVQARAAGATDTAPANPRACPLLDAASPGYCTDHHATDADYLDRITFAKSPSRACGDGHTNCVGYAGWVTAWRSITAG